MSLSRIASVLAVATLIACAGASRAPTTATAQNDDLVDAGADEADGGEDEEAEAENETDAGTTEENPIATDEGPCPSEMVLVEAEGVRVCVDRWEASLVEVDADGNETPFPHWLPVDGHSVRAVSVPDVFPQGYISEVQAEDACAASHKRLCLEDEWMTACAGPEKTTFPYGEARRPDACHDNGKSAVGAVFGAQALASSTPVVVSKPAAKTVAAKASAAKTPAKSGKPVHKTSKKAAVTTKTRPSRTTTPPKRPPAKPKAIAKSSKKKKPAAAKVSQRPAGVDDNVWHKLNDPRLGQVDGALAKTGSHGDCTNGYGVLDMMGNIHEWVKTPASVPRGTFCGGYYLDTSINGDGCKYRTRAHAHDYHDYSTGFRCCADPR